VDVSISPHVTSSRWFHARRIPESICDGEIEEEGRVITLTAGQKWGTAVNVANAEEFHRALLEMSNVRDVSRGPHRVRKTASV